MKTQSFNPASSNLGATLKQGTKMIFGGDVANYTLVFLDPTTTDKVQTSKVIVVPNITIGRASACHVRYGDEYPTVSRQHASITGSSNQFFLNHNPQASNPTFVNSQPAQGPHLLKNEDVIQFSQNGPRLRFLASAVKTSTMGMTARVNRVLGQAIKPYKKAVMWLGILLLGSLLFGGYNYYQNTVLEKDLVALNSAKIENEKDLLDAKLNLENLKKQSESDRNQSVADRKKISVQEKKVKDLQDKNQELNNLIVQINPPENNSDNANNNLSSDSNTNDGTSSGISNYPLREFDNDIYFIKVEGIEVVLGQDWDGNNVVHQLNASWSGTGFLTKSGKFITARHVLEGWKWFERQGECKNAQYSQPPSLMRLNSLDISGGVTVKYVARSPRGDVLRFTNKMVTMNDVEDVIDCNKYKKALWEAVYADWATIDFPMRAEISKIEINRDFSKQLKKGIELEISGYARGSALQSDQSELLDPLYSKGIVAQDNLVNKVINVTGMSTDGGQSGGPVFVKNESTGKYEVIGMVHGKFGRIGRVVPIWYAM